MASSSAASNINANPTTAQYSADANLMAEFEKSDESGKSFNYARSVTGAAQATEEQITAYLSRIQRGGLVQPFGCLLAIEESTFKIIGYSENCFDMLGLKSVVESKGIKGLVGVDARSLFAPSSRGSLTKAVSTRDISLLNPVWVHSKSNRKPFYAILHRIDVGTVIDLEPAHSGDPTMLHASAVQSQKLAVKVISRLQSLPGGDIGVLCDMVVENVQKLTGYDRVMVYKFHDDDHGEVVSEIIRSDLEPFFGLHYPATDIPQAARFLFKQNRVRMICDCNAQPVKIVQTEELKQPLCLVNSTLRAPHGCHMQYMVNMGSIASLAMAVLINNGDSMKLWGLVVCHHTSPRYIPFPLRYACEFLIQAFNLQLYMELQLAAQLAEKNILRMQTLLCDMLLRDAPFGIMTQSPSIMDLVKCDGAALYYQGKCWLLGVTPAEAQIIDIAEWLLTNHGDSTGLSTESLADAGYPGAALLGDRVCGMAMARITSTDFLFWFRSHTAKEIKWAGAKHLPESEDDGRKMHPRSSFNVFLEIVKSRSLSWEVTEINAIHSLQLILRGSLDESSPEFVSYPQHYDGGPGQLRELTSVAVEMVRLIETARVPIFGVDSSGLVNGWNAKMCELTGLKASEALGKSLVIDVIHEDSHKVVEAMMRRALQGVEDKNIEVKLLNFGAQESNSVIYLLVNACTSRDYKNDVVGVCFVGHDVTAEKNVMDKFTRLQGDYKAIIQSLNPLVPPIFASDVNACCAEWNAAMEKLTGWTRDQVIGKMLPGDIFGSLCHLKSHDALTKFMVLLYRAISGQENEKIPFGFFNRKGEPIDVFLSANKRADKSGNVIGCLCFVQIVVDQQQSRIDKQENRKRLSELKELAYIKQEMRNPLSGIRFTHKLLEGSAVTDDQKQFLETSNACERQLLSIIDDTNFGSLDYCGKMELKMEEFLLGNVVDAIVSQAMILLNKKNLRFMHEIPEQIKTLSLYGDRIRLQSALSNFLIRIVDYAPSRDGWVEIKISPELKLVRDGNEYVRLQFRMTHPGQGLPYTIIEDMFSTKNHLTTEEGFALNISQKLLAMMHGNVRYMRDQTKCYFLIDVELELHKSRQRSSSLNRSR